MKSPLPPSFLFSKDVPAPCYLIDEEALCRNCAILEDIQRKTGVRILLALKAFACWSLFPVLSRAYQGVLWGTCASSVDEARLGREEFGGEVHVFSSGYDTASVLALCELVDTFSFNSIAQFRRFWPTITAFCAKTGRTIHAGIRINPEYTESTHAIYDPCDPSSRLGVRRRDFDEAVFAEGVSGLHCHTLCEQNADVLARTLTQVYAKFGSLLTRSSWVNLGGGHHITRDDYDRDCLCREIVRMQEYTNATVYLEPGEAVALESGWLSATVLDCVMADVWVVILDVSITCHMPDVLEMPYRPRVYYEDAGSICEAKAYDGQGVCVRLAGNSCLAGDVVPFLYSFSRLPCVGDRLLFADMAIYSMVKTTTFNGLRLPSIASFRGERLRLLRQFGYEDFKSRLS
ncbi:MAG: carboxynorspermidine decarboxylase [Desulfovibrio sp.]|nr:carboxynorspermidine decarboxylase [Desulfovibrio sp.]